MAGKSEYRKMKVKDRIWVKNLSHAESSQNEENITKIYSNFSLK